MSERNVRTHGGITVAHFGSSGDIRTNLMPAELADLETLAGGIDIDTALAIGAELEPLTIALHYIAGARATAGVGAFGSWHDPFGTPMKTAVPAGLDLPMFEATSPDPALLETVVSDAFGSSSVDLVVDTGTSSLDRRRAFWALLPRLSPRARYLLRRSTPLETVGGSDLGQLDASDLVPAVMATGSYDVAALAHDASLDLADTASPISRISLGRAWVTIEVARSD